MLTVYHELDPTFYSATSKTFIGRIYALLGLKNIADAADKAAPATRSSRPSTSSREPRPDRPRRHEVLRSDARRRSRRGPAGARSRPSAAGRSSGSTTVASRWGPRVVDFMQAVGDRVGPRRLRAARGDCDQVQAAARRRARPRSWRRPRGASRPVASCSARSSSACSPARCTSGSATSFARRSRISFSAVDARLRRRRGDPLAAARAAGRARRARRRHARPGGGGVPGRLPQPARRPVPARRRRRRRLGATLAIAYLPGALDGHQLLRSPRSSAARSPSSSPTARPLGGPGARRGDAGARRRHGRSFLTAVQTFVQQQHSDTLQEVYAWILGRAGDRRLAARSRSCCRTSSSHRGDLRHRRVLDVLSRRRRGGGEPRRGRRRVRLLLVVAATIGTAAAVAVSGLIGFVGIIVPHTVRLASARATGSAAALDALRRRLPRARRRGRAHGHLARPSCRSASSPRSSARRSSRSCCARSRSFA